MKVTQHPEIVSKLRILTIRDQRVLLDADLARLYGVETRALNQAVKRNQDRFPAEFAFQLTDDEFLSISQTVTSNTATLTSQFVMSKPGRGGRRHRPYAFTEHGALQAASVVNSPQAVQMSLYVIRAFVKMREELTANVTILKRLAEIDKTLLQHDSALRDVHRKLLPLLQPPPEPPKRRIGFNADNP
jgi:ORF6N domain